MTIELKARDLKIGDEFTTLEDQGEVWFKVIELEPPAFSAGLIDVLGVVVSHNPDTDYAVGDSEWSMLHPDEKVILR